MADDRVKMVKEASDIVAVVGGYLPLTPAGSLFKALCPFHGDTRPSLQIDPKWQNFRCWACDKRGDVFTFIQEMEKVSFVEALELLARRAGIALDQTGPHPGKARLLDAIRWAAQLYQDCLLESPLAQQARKYLGDRKLVGETVRRFGLGFAPLSGDWLIERASREAIDLNALVEVGLLGVRDKGAGFYDRFRDRVMFPIRDPRGQVVGFGGRILPDSPLASRAPKYYNSADTLLFNKSDLIYGLDLARTAAATVGYLAVVEGYTDVLMAHQAGVPQVVATMGTALNARHVQQLRRFVPRVVLVFDADAGGMTGVDRALEIFVSHDLELAVATLPEGLDPCDQLVRDGPDAFRRVLETAVDALDFKMDQVLAREEGHGIEGRRRAVDAVLGIIALAPEVPGKAAQVKRELIITRIAHRLGLREATVWSRLRELRAERRAREDGRPERAPVAVKPPVTGSRHGKADPEERELIEVLLAEPMLVAKARGEVPVEEIRHPDVRALLTALYDLHDQGKPPELDNLRLTLDGWLVEAAMKLQEIGRFHSDRAAWLERILKVFRDRRALSAAKAVHNQLSAAADHAAAMELLRQLQQKTLSPDG